MIILMIEQIFHLLFGLDHIILLSKLNHGDNRIIFKTRTYHPENLPGVIIRAASAAAAGYNCLSVKNT